MAMLVNTQLMILLLIAMSVDALPTQPSSGVLSVPLSARQPSLQPDSGSGNDGQAGGDEQEQKNERDVILSTAVHDAVAEVSDDNSVQVTSSRPPSI